MELCHQKDQCQKKDTNPRLGYVTKHGKTRPGLRILPQVDGRTEPPGIFRPDAMRSCGFQAVKVSNVNRDLWFIAVIYASRSCLNAVAGKCVSVPESPG
jgi:hypothetical protein